MGEEHLGSVDELASRVMLPSEAIEHCARDLLPHGSLKALEGNAGNRIYLGTRIWPFVAFCATKFKIFVHWTQFKLREFSGCLEDFLLLFK